MTVRRVLGMMERDLHYREARAAGRHARTPWSCSLAGRLAYPSMSSPRLST